MSHYIDTPNRDPPNKELIGSVSSDPTIERLRQIKLNREEEEKVRKQREENQNDENRRSGAPVISKRALVETCMAHGGYEYPELNDKLYLHFKGYKKMEGLDEYLGVKTLFLESNNFSTAHIYRYTCAVYVAQSSSIGGSSSSSSGGSSI